MKKILLVDDSPSVTELVARMLTSTGNYIVKAENDSRRAVRTVTAFQPDLIIMDVDMPNLDGGDVSSRLERDPSTRQIPIIFLTSLCAPGENRSSSDTSSTQRILAKPIPRNTLLAEVRSIIAPSELPARPFVPSVPPFPIRCGLAG